MRRVAGLTVIAFAAAMAAQPVCAQPVSGLTPSVVAAAIDHADAASRLRAIDPQAGGDWGHDLERFLDQASGYEWRRRGAAVQMGYQQRDFAPQPPSVDGRGYEAMLKDAPDMMGVSIKLRTR